MNIRLVREPSIDRTTLGVVFVDGAFFAFSLEDRVREVPGQPVAAWKVPGQTAIPSGRYRVKVTPSSRFKRDLPELLDVPGFLGIRIHPGNTDADTEGCVLLGVRRSGAALVESRPAVVELQDLIGAAAKRGEETWIVIEAAQS